MVVVQINASYGYGSTGRTVKEMHEYLINKGVDSYCYCPTVGIDNKNVNVIGSNMDHKIHAFCSRIFGRQAFFSYFSTRRIIRAIKKKRPDVVILRNVHSNYINLPLICDYLADNNVPTVLVLHDCWFYTGHCFHYTEVGCEKWKNECNHCPLIHSHNASLFLDTSRNVFRAKKRLFSKIPRLAVVGVSDWIANEAKQSPIFENAISIKRIYNWIDLSVFYPRDPMLMREKHGIRAEVFVALGVAMDWDYHKGLDTFIEVANVLSDITIVLIGNIPHQALPPNIISVARTDSVQELAAYYSMADVLLNLSIQESFGKVPAEALACGTPIIVNDATANPEIPGDCGLVISNNIDSIVAGIKRLKSIGKEFFQNKCLDRARLLFEKENNIVQYETLFKEMRKNY